jgi:hypothetical protein
MPIRLNSTFFSDPDDLLKKLKPNILVHASGLFQNQGYEVAAACIHNGVHYLDLADRRDFVANMRKGWLFGQPAPIFVLPIGFIHHRWQRPRPRGIGRTLITDIDWVMPGACAPGSRVQVTPNALAEQPEPMSYAGTRPR